MRYQSPSIEKHGKRRRLRAYVTERQPDGTYKRVRKSITLGTKDDTASEIKRRAAGVLGQINAGTLIVERQIKVAELLAMYRQTGLPLVAASTREKYSAHLNKIAKAFGALELGEVKTQMVQDWFTGMAADYSRATLLDIRNLFGALFTFARRMQIWSSIDTPVRFVKLRSAIAPREKRLIRAAELHRLCEELDRCEAVVQGSITGRDVRLMLLIAAVTTLRISEVLRLEMRHISTDGQVVIEQSKTEAGRRTVWLGDLREEVLSLGRTGLLFPRANGGPVDRRDLQQHILRPCAERAGLYYPGFGFHSFRRLSITLHQQSGATPIEAMRAAGHTKPSMTMLYTLADVDRERERAQQISRRLAG